MKYQSIKNKSAEINFRKKIAKQQLDKHLYFKHERSFNDMFDELKRRTEKTKVDFRILKSKGVDFSSYLEIGAENCERAALLDNYFKVNGVASDISLPSLQASPGFAKAFKYKKKTRRLVCDAYNLPYADNSVPFIFCYQTLHHFPDPKPIIEEIYRVLTPGGYFYFDEEPVKQLVNIPLWRRPTRLRYWEKILKYMGILPFISKIGKTEVDHGILEEVFSLKTWEKAVQIFEKVEVTVIPFPKGPQDTKIKIGRKNWLRPKLVTFLLLAWLGGGIKAICQKKKMDSKIRRGRLNGYCCPTCITKNSRNKKKAILIRLNTSYSCNNCKTEYPVKNNIPIIIPKKEIELLYNSNRNNDT